MLRYSISNRLPHIAVSDLGSLAPPRKHYEQFRILCLLVAVLLSRPSSLSFSQWSCSCEHSHPEKKNAHVPTHVSIPENQKKRAEGPLRTWHLQKRVEKEPDHFLSTDKSQIKSFTVKSDCLQMPVTMSSSSSPVLSQSVIIRRRRRARDARRKSASRNPSRAVICFLFRNPSGCRRSALVTKSL